MTQAPVLSLKNLLVPSKKVDVEFPGFPGFVLTLAFLSRETLVNIRKKSLKTTFVSKTRQTVEEVDDKIFLDLYTKAAIKGWKGLTFAHLEQLAPIDTEGTDLNTELGYSEENALYLMQASADFDAFITATVGDLGNFSKSNASK